MSVDYQKRALRADKQIRKYGAAATVRTVTEGAYDTATSTSTDTTTDSAAKACVFAIEQKDLANTLVQSTDQKAYVSAVGLSLPNTSDLFIWQGVTYKIVTVKDLAPAGISCLFELVIRA